MDTTTVLLGPEGQSAPSSDTSTSKHRDFGSIETDESHTVNNTHKLPQQSDVNLENVRDGLFSLQPTKCTAASRWSGGGWTLMNGTVLLSDGQIVLLTSSCSVVTIRDVIFKGMHPMKSHT